MGRASVLSMRDRSQRPFLFGCSAVTLFCAIATVSYLPVGGAIDNGGGGRSKRTRSNFAIGCHHRRLDRRQRRRAIRQALIAVTVGAATSAAERSFKPNKAGAGVAEKAGRPSDASQAATVAAACRPLARIPPVGWQSPSGAGGAVFQHVVTARRRRRRGMHTRCCCCGGGGFAGEGLRLPVRVQLA